MGTLPQRAQRAQRTNICVSSSVASVLSVALRVDYKYHVIPIPKDWKKCVERG